MEKKYLCYEDFGAIGDGITDDFDAIIACHEEANRSGIPVKTLDGARYYIGGADKTAHVRTDVDFGSSEFIIDDRNVEKIDSYVFTVDSEAETFIPEIKALEKNQTHIDFPHKGKVYVRVFNDNKRIFIRKGLNKNSGTAVTDCFTVDENGNIGEGIDWSYPEITRVYAKSIDDKPITIKGGVFTTVANQAESFYRYHKRGFSISRSNVTVKDLTHYVEGELDHGAPYHGFIFTCEAVNITIRDCLLTPRFIYYTASRIPGKSVAMGSYDISLSASIGVKCYNVTQTISIEDKRYWGIYTSNFSKNLVLEDCVLSRFDAHQGVTGLTIKRCRFGHQGMNLIGHGNALIEDTEVTAAMNYIYLRGDYGSIWDGNITVRRGSYTPHESCNNIRLIGADNNGDHDYGYDCMMGINILIDGMKVHDKKRMTESEAHFEILGKYDHVVGVEKPFRYIPPKTVCVKNIETDSGLGYGLFAVEEQYRGTEIIDG